MKKRNVVLVALAVLLAGGRVTYQIRSTEAPDEGAEVKGPAKTAKAKATKVVSDSPEHDVVVARFGFSVKE